MSDQAFTVRRANASDAADIAQLAAATFAQACPPHTSDANIAAHIETALSPSQFEIDLTTDGTVFYVAEPDEGQELIGYAMLVRGVAVPGVKERAEPTEPRSNPVELRRIYVLASWQGRGVADALMECSLHHSRTHGYATIWLGTNEANTRAMSFYERNGFAIVGARNFNVGDAIECDHVLVRHIDPPAE